MYFYSCSVVLGKSEEPRKRSSFWRFSCLTIEDLKRNMSWETALFNTAPVSWDSTPREEANELVLWKHQRTHTLQTLLLGRVTKPPDNAEEKKRPETSAEIPRVLYFISSAIVASEWSSRLLFPATRRIPYTILKELKHPSEGVSEADWGPELPGRILSLISSWRHAATLFES